MCVWVRVCVYVHVCMADIIHKQSESRAKEGTVFIYYYLPRVYHDVSTWYKGEGALLYFQWRVWLKSYTFSMWLCHYSDKSSYIPLTRLGVVPECECSAGRPVCTMTWSIKETCNHLVTALLSTSKFQGFPISLHSQKREKQHEEGEPEQCI